MKWPACRYKLTIICGKTDRLERFTSLESLDLQRTPVPDLFTVAHRLKELTINQSFNKVPVPRSVGTLTNLEHLNIQYTCTTDIGALANLQNLEILSIVDGEMDSIEAVGKLTKLKSLYITSDSKYSIDPLKHLTNLTGLELSGKFSKIEALSSLKMLQRLDLQCDCDDLTPLGQLQELETLDIGMCFNIESIEPLFALKYLKNLTAKTHFMNQWKTRDIPDSPEKIFSQIRRPAEILQERRDGLIRSVHAYPDEAKKILPIRIETVEELLGQVDEESVIRSFKGDFFNGISSLSDPEKFQALYYEWYEGGNEHDSLAMGVAYETCKGPFFYSGTDLVKVEGVPGIEIDEPRFSDDYKEVIELDISPVRSIWYENFHEKFNDETQRSLVGTDLLDYYNDAEMIYQELFLIKIYRLANLAYDSIQENKPGFCFLMRHGRWPVLISGF